MPEKKRPRYYRDAVVSMSILLLRDGAALGVPLPERGRPPDRNGFVRLWRFASNQFELVLELPWDELPLRDQSLPEHQQKGRATEETEEESRASWQKWHKAWLAQYKPVNLHSWDSYSDVWTVPPWILSVSIKVGRKSEGGEVVFDIMGCKGFGNIEDGGTLMLYLPDGEEAGPGGQG